MRTPTLIRFPGSGIFPDAGRLRRLAMVTAVAFGSIGVGGALMAQPVGALPNTIFVSTSGTDTAGCGTSSGAGACATLGGALSPADGDAVSGDTILIEPGTYLVTADPSGTSNTVPAALTGLTIESDASAIPAGDAANTIINAAGGINGLVVNASDTVVNGLTFENGGAAGIYVSPPSSATPPSTVTGETIENNVVNDSDQCEKSPSTTACKNAIGAGDYGESIWLESVTSSTISGNTVENGLAGGMLVSDEVGPNDGNTIESNQVLNNADGCGITLAGHNQNAVFSSGPDAGQPDPAAGGVYNDTVKDNTSDGAGANGVGLFNFAYNNTIEGNTLDGNGGPGVEIDSTFPGGDLNGNTVEGNTVGVNSLLGGPGGDSPGQHTVHTTQTGGVLVIALASPVTGTVIQNNTITGDYYGIWMSALAASTTLSGNTISISKGGVAIFVSPAPGAGYWPVGSDGGVFTFGKAPFEGSTGNVKLDQPVKAMAATPDGGGYWLAAKDGGLFSFGDANYYGSVPGLGVHVSNIVGMAATPDGGGYWLVGSDGGVFAFGDAKYNGSLPGLGVHVSNIVGIAGTSDGGGYWLVGSDGGVFAFGDAKYKGSLPGLGVHVSNIVGIAGSSDGGGYWLVGSDGGVFTFGDAKYEGSLPGLGVHVSNVMGVAGSPDNGGYWLVGSDGGVFTFGDATYNGSLPGLGVHVSNIVGLVTTP